MFARSSDVAMGMELPKVGSIGEYIRQQRQWGEISRRQLAAQAGVSNPYLSRMSRGMRKPNGRQRQC